MKIIFSNLSNLGFVRKNSSLYFLIILFTIKLKEEMIVNEELKKKYGWQSYYFFIIGLAIHQTTLGM